MRLATLASSALVVAAGTLSGAGPAGAVTVWQGIATITAATPACSGASSERLKIGIGTNLRTVLRPKNVADNGPDTRVSFVHDGQANFAIFLPGGSAAGTYAAFGANYNGMIMANEAAAYRGVTLTPRKPTDENAFVTAAGAIDNFMFIKNCTVSFTAAYALRP
jgi:hypothetical protein